MTKTCVFLFAVVIVAACSANKSGPALPAAGTIAGTLTGAGGPLQNAEVKLNLYKDENCVKLGQQNKKRSPEEDAQFKQCHQELSTSTTDAQGKYSFPNIATGWYSVAVNWTTTRDPLPSNPMWKPLFLYRADDFLITFIAAKDGSFRMVAACQPFQFQGGGTMEKNLALKL